MTAKVSIVGTFLGGTAGGFNASGGAKAQGVKAKKIAEEARLITSDVVDDLMKKRVIPQMLNMIP